MVAWNAHGSRRRGLDLFALFFRLCSDLLERRRLGWLLLAALVELDPVEALPRCAGRNHLAWTLTWWLWLASVGCGAKP